MKRLIVSLVLMVSFSSGWSQEIQVVNQEWITAMRNNKQNDTLYIINFWATWCKPCVEEMPHFEKINEKYKLQKIKVLLVSNDMRKELTGRLPKFIQDKKIQSQVLFMNETNANNWIEKVNSSWSGAIPATWLLQAAKGRELFHEGELNEQEIEQLITKINQ